MFSYWYITFGFIALTIALLVTYILYSRKSKNEDLHDTLAISTIALGVISAFLILFSWLAPLVALDQYSRKKNFYEAYNLHGYVVFDNSTYDYTDVAFYNSWILHAKTDKETLGNFSIYFNVPVENMEYIEYNVKSN